MNSDITPRPVSIGPLGGHYEPNFPGAATLRDARALYVGGKHVTAEVSDREITIFIGTLIAYTGPLPDFITERWQVNTWVAEHVHALEVTVSEAHSGPQSDVPAERVIWADVKAAS